MQKTSRNDVMDFIDVFAKRFSGAMFCEIGYRAIRGGKWTWEIRGMHGNTYINNEFLKFFPIFDNDIQASEAVILFCKKHWQFQNKQHMDIYDYLPLHAGG